jgi:HAMP domain-containing protein
MRIQTRLIAYFLVMVMLVPVLGGIAIGRVRNIDSTVEDLSNNAIPNLRRAEGLADIQRQQQGAALNYLSSGRAEDRQKYLDLGQSFDQEFAKLKAADTSDASKDEIQAITAERAKFTSAAVQVVNSRDAIDRNLANLRAKNVEMVTQLNSIRARFASGGGSNAGSDIGQIPTTLRNQVNDLLLGTEGMLHQTANVFALASSNAIAPSDSVRADMDTAGQLFTSAFQVANNAGGPEDRAILTKVQAAFGQFDSSARAMLNAGDVAARQRGVFLEEGDTIAGILNGYVNAQAGQVANARTISANSVNSAQRMILIIMFGGMAVAITLGFVFASTITGPIERLRDVADRVSTGNMDDVDIEVKGKDEIAQLADSFRRMVASIRYFMHQSQDSATDTGDSLDFDFGDAPGSQAA